MSIPRLASLDATASLAHGLTTRQRLVAADVPRSTIDRWLRTGVLLDVHDRAHGVYRHVGAPFTDEARVLAAVLAIGEDAVASHATAVRVWGLWPHGTGMVDVAVGRRSKVDPACLGIRLHHSRKLPAAERDERDGIPVTTVARTICDVARSVRPRTVADLVADASSRDLLDIADLQASLDRRLRFPGRRAVALALAGFSQELARFLSKLERHGRTMLIDAGLPGPRVNYPVTGASGTIWACDLAYPGVGLDLELDGPAHAQPSQQRRDRRRDADLQAVGWVVDRFSEEEVRSGAFVGPVLARLRELEHPALRCP